MTDRLVHKVWLSLGSNLGDRAAQLAQAHSQLSATCGKVLRISGMYESSAWGFESEHMFYNQCLQMETVLSPDALMHQLIKIEKQMGRYRNGQGYADRPVDLDILFIDDLVIHTAALQIPHPRMADRKFVLLPLSEIAAGKKDPVTGRTVGEMLKKCTDSSRVEKIIP